MSSSRIAARESSPASCCRLYGLHRPCVRRQRRYPSDLSDAQWQLIDPLLPDPAWIGQRGGRPETWCRRQTVDAILYVVDDGCKWRALPADFPPWSSVYNYSAAWQAAGVAVDILDTLRGRIRLRDGRTATPTAAVIDSPSVEAAETVWRSGRGYDAGKKINGRKRHIAVDTGGLLIRVLVTDAPVQDRIAARPLLDLLAQACRQVRLVWADGGYLGTLTESAAATWNITVKIIKRSDQVTGFVVLPRRWVVERSLGWITRHRRCVRDYEGLIQHHEAIVYWSMIHIMVRRLTKPPRTR